jgi:hypothetical protein
MVPTPLQPTRRYGLGAVNWHTGETLFLTRPHKREHPVRAALRRNVVGAENSAYGQSYAQCLRAA